MCTHISRLLQYITHLIIRADILIRLCAVVIVTIYINIVVIQITWTYVVNRTAATWVSAIVVIVIISKD